MKPSCLCCSDWFFGLAACFSVWLCCSVYASAALGLSTELLGVSPLDEKYYSSQLIKCKDGSKSFVKARLNDGYCDCSDGTDEPGTSACPEGRFYCRNKGHSPVTLFSSRVNDGICDCCDGSDEYDGKVKCSNTCWEAGKAAREKLVKKIATYQEGSTLREKEIDKAKQEFVKEKEELSNLKKEEKLLKDLVDKLRERKEQIEKVEEQERLEKEKEEAKKKEAEDKLNEEEKKTEEPTSSSPSELVEEKLDFPEEPEGGDGSDTKDEAENIHSDVSEVESDITSQKEHETSESTVGLSREELGRLVASRWTGQSQNDDHHPKEDDHHAKDDAHDKKEDDHVGNFENSDASDDPEDGSGNNHDDYPSHNHDTYPSDNHDNYPSHNHDNYPSDNHDNYPSDNDETNHEWEDKYEDEEEEEDYEVENEDFDHNTPDIMHDDVNDAAEVSDLPPASRLSWLNKIQNAFQSVLAALKLSNTPVDKSEADRVRKEYRDYNGKLSKVQSRISSLTDKLKEDFGPQKEFYSFYGTCFEYKENKYVYKVCPYKQASQNEGHSSTQLGRWEKFEESYRVMRFSNGDKCWNGPDRSLKIRLRCGLKNELTDVDEPSRCEYVALLSTPAVCVEEKLKELEKKLDDLNAGRHDEL